jgi:hypothetical protein
VASGGDNPCLPRLLSMCRNSFILWRTRAPSLLQADTIASDACFVETASMGLSSLPPCLPAPLILLVFVVKLHDFKDIWNENLGGNLSPPLNIQKNKVSVDRCSVPWLWSFLCFATLDQPANKIRMHALAYSLGAYPLSTGQSIPAAQHIDKAIILPPTHNNCHEFSKKLY